MVSREITNERVALVKEKEPSASSLAVRGNAIEVTKLNSKPIFYIFEEGSAELKDVWYD